MTKEAMLKEMCSYGLGQGEIKTLGRARGFDAATLASRELLNHVFLSDQGVQAALASLTPPEVLGLHLLHCLGEDAKVEFFKRIYPGLTSSNLYGGSYTERYKGLFHQVKTRLMLRGVLLTGTLSEYECNGAVLERRRFRFPEEFAAFLPPPFQARRPDLDAAKRDRKKVLREKFAQIPLELGVQAAQDKQAAGQWGLANGELLFDGQPFRAARLEAWPWAQFETTVPHSTKGEREALRLASLLRYALSQLPEGEWLAADDLLPLFKMAPGPKTPDPQTVCEAAFQCGCIEKAECDGITFYRLPQQSDAEASALPQTFLDLEDARMVRIRLDHTPLVALERLSEVSRFEIAEGGLWVTPSLLKISHAPAETLADPVVQWLFVKHPAFKNAIATFELKRGKLIVHENLLVARVSDLALKVALEKKFAAPGQLVSLSREFVTFPTGLLPEIQSWMKKSGHVIKTSTGNEPD